MATASSSEYQISCSLCLDVFKKPRVLSCGHSFCTKCLQDYINKNDQNNKICITCPSCNQDIHIPDSTKPVETWADQFPVNLALVDSIKERQSSKIWGKRGHISVLTSVTDRLKTFKTILQSEMEEKIEKLRQDVDINVVETAEEIRRAGNKLITDFTDIVNQEQDRLIREIEKYQITVNSETEKLFTEHKHLIEENKKLIKLGEDLIKRRSECDIKSNISKFTNLENTTSEFLSKIDKVDFKINLTKSERKKEMSVHIGEISTNIQSDTQIDRLTKTLEHTDTIKTRTQKEKTNPWMDSILLSGENKSKILVSDSYNTCVKCVCLQRQSDIQKCATSSPPCGLAESRDQEGAFVVLPLEEKILILNLKKFKFIKTVKTNKMYWYITVLPNNRLAVTGYISGQYLDILTDSGQLINSISTDVIPEPSCLTVHDQCLIVVTQRNDVNSLVCVTSSGDVKWESRDSDRLRKLRGVTCDMEGNIYVCDYDRDCVVQLSREGKVLRDILTEQDGLSLPVSLCFHDNKLYVGQYNGEIQIYTWCKK